MNETPQFESGTLPILDEANEYVRMRKLGLSGGMHPVRQRKAIRVAELLHELEGVCRGDKDKFSFCVGIVKDSKQDHEKKLQELIDAINNGELFAVEKPPDTTGMTRQQKRAVQRKTKKKRVKK